LTGIGRYTYKVSKELKRVDSFELNFFYGYYSKNLIEPSSKNGVENLKSIISKSVFLKKVARKILILSSRLFAPKYELYWQPNFIPNDGIRADKIVTSVHDFSFIEDRKFHPKERIAYYEKYFFRNVVRSDMIITGSEYTKREILERTDFTDDKVRVIYHGLVHTLFRVYNIIELDFEIPSKFILSVGSIEPRKNLLRLLRAYNTLPHQIRDEYKLVLVGFKGWENSEIMSLIEEGGESIIYLGYISDEELAKVYNLASLFLFPSLYEGFGLPLLEAMACGTAVVSSNLSSLPEVGGDAPLYCDPYSIDDIREKIEKVLSDSTLQQEMIQKGLEQVKKFSWEKSAEEHLKLFEEVLKN
jgi:glycosyltransferase involved in cell wall biosynthesis